MGIRVFIVGYEMECENSFFSKTGCTGESLMTRMSREFQSPTNRMARLYFFSCSDSAVLTLQLPTCFTRMPHFGESPLTSQSRDPVASCLLMHTLDQFFTLSHTRLLLPTCFTRVPHSGESPLASQLRKSSRELPLNAHT